jgi:hypothetical protein
MSPCPFRRYDCPANGRNETGKIAFEPSEQRIEIGGRITVARSLFAERRQYLRLLCRKALRQKRIWADRADVSWQPPKVLEVGGYDHTSLDLPCRSGDMTILGIVEHFRFETFPPFDGRVRESPPHLGGETVCLDSRDAMLRNKIASHLVKNPLGPMRAIATCRRHAEERVAQDHRKQDIGVEDGGRDALGSTTPLPLQRQGAAAAFASMAGAASPSPALRLAAFIFAWARVASFAPTSIARSRKALIVASCSPARPSGSNGPLPYGSSPSSRELRRMMLGLGRNARPNFSSPLRPDLDEAETFQQLHALLPAAHTARGPVKPDA